MSARLMLTMLLIATQAHAGWLLLGRPALPKLPTFWIRILYGRRALVSPQQFQLLKRPLDAPASTPKPPTVKIRTLRGGSREPLYRPQIDIPRPWDAPTKFRCLVAGSQSKGDERGLLGVCGQGAG